MMPIRIFAWHFKSRHKLKVRKAFTKDLQVLHPWHTEDSSIASASDDDMIWYDMMQ